MAAATLLYLLKANGALLLAAATYYGLLRQLTFFRLNRAYLAVALLFAAVYPALPVPALLPAAPLLHAARVGTVVGPDWLAIGLAGYALGAAWLLLRLLGQLGSLALVLGQAVRVLPGAGGPFSFGRTIYLSEAALADEASLPAVLRHEQAHVRQWHTLDVLLAQLTTALAWPNPAAWLLRRAVLDNLEYLADHAALRTGLDRRAYQYSLLRQQPGGVPAPALAFHFSFLTLKNRITMLNQPASTTRQLGRYLLAAPLLLGLALGYSSAQAQGGPTPAPAQPKVMGNPTYYVDGKLTTKSAMEQVSPSAITAINVIKGAQQQQLFGTTNPAGTVVVTTKAEANSPEALAFAKRVATVSPFKPATPEQTAAVAAVQAYVSKNYPNATLEMVGPQPDQANRYRAIFEQGGKRLQLLFDGQGQPVQQ